MTKAEVGNTLKGHFYFLFKKKSVIILQEKQNMKTCYRQNNYERKVLLTRDLSFWILILQHPKRWLILDKQIMPRASKILYTLSDLPTLPPPHTHYPASIFSVRSPFPILKESLFLLSQ